MAEYSNAVVQNVAAGSNVLFTETPVCGGKCIQHREGSGIITLRGLTNQCRARYKVSFSGNIAAVTTAEEISVAISIAGEALNSATMAVTPAAIDQYFNVSGAAFIEVPQGCCVTVAVKNISTQAITVRNANLIAERVA